MKMMVMLFQVNDSSMALLGGTHGDDYRHIVELVVNKMEVYCRTASQTTTIRFLSRASAASAALLLSAAKTTEPCRHGYVSIVIVVILANAVSFIHDECTQR